MLRGAFRQASCNFLHVDVAVRRTFHAISFHGKIKWLLNRPNFVVFVWCKNHGRIAHCDPVDRNRGLFRQDTLDVDNAVDSHFRLFANSCALKNCDSGGEENLILQSAAIQRCIWADPHVITNAHRILGGRANDGVLSDDGLSADHNRIALGDEDGAERHVRIWTDRNVAAHDCGWRDKSGPVNGWPFAAMLE